MIMKSLKGQTILITGAAGGLGREFARQLLTLGAHLILTDLDEKALTETFCGRQEAPGKILGVIGADISHPDGCRHLYQAAGKLAPRLDMLINNAGLINYGCFWEIPPERWEKLIEVNLMAPMRLCRLFIPDMVRHGGGHLVFICSVGGFAATALGTPYVTTRFGLRGFAMALSGEVRDKGMQTTIVYPSWVKTELLASPTFGSARVGRLSSFMAEDPVTSRGRKHPGYPEEPAARLPGPVRRARPARSRNPADCVAAIALKKTSQRPHDFHRQPVGQPGRCQRVEQHHHLCLGADHVMGPGPCGGQGVVYGPVQIRIAIGEDFCIPGTPHPCATEAKGYIPVAGWFLHFRA